MAKLGTQEHPAVIRVQTEERGAELVALANERGWQIIVGIEPDKAENISDLRKLMKVNKTVFPKSDLPPKVSGNDYCPCRSGLKYKKCCGAPAANGASA